MTALLPWLVMNSEVNILNLPSFSILTCIEWRPFYATKRNIPRRNTAYARRDLTIGPSDCAYAWFLQLSISYSALSLTEAAPEFAQLLGKCQLCHFQPKFLTCLVLLP
jgi:hypothetical protein